MEGSNITKTETAAPSLDVVKAQFALELQKNGFAELQTLSDTIQVNEDNVEEVKEHIAKIKALYKIVDEKHTEKKKPYLEAGRVIDAAKNSYYEILNGILNPIQKKYITACNNIAAAEKKRKDEEQRVSVIKQGIEQNRLHLSQKISNCDTSDAIVALEREIILLKGRPQNKQKFQEFLPEFESMLTDLSKDIKEQKVKIRQLENVRKQISKSTSGDDVVELQEKAEQLEADIEEKKIVVQEKAIDQSTSFVPVATVVHPTVKPRRTTWKWEVTDLSKLAKKMPHLVKVVPDEDAIKAVLETKKTDGSLEGKDEEILHGLKFYAEKLF